MCKLNVIFKNDIIFHSSIALCNKYNKENEKVKSGVKKNPAMSVGWVYETLITFGKQL